MATFDVVLERDESGTWVATVPALPGCISQGATKAEARRNIREAIELHLESFPGEDSAHRVELTRIRAVG